MITTIFLLSFGALFTVYEFVAHFVFHNINVETLSTVVRLFVKHHRFVGGGGVTLVLIALWLHLVLQLF